MFITSIAVLFFVRIQRTNADFEVSTPYVRVGCYGDVSRPLPDLLGNYYYSVTWNTIDSVIKNCSKLAQSKGHRYFSLQHYGECWSGMNADLTYARDGSSDACVKGVGKKGANFVYKLLNTLDHSCDLGWYSTKDTCFKIANDTTIKSIVQASEYCSKYHGLFHLANTAHNFLTQDRLIKTLLLNKQLNDSTCLVLSDVSVTYTGVLKPWNESMGALASGHTASSLGTSYQCAVKDVHGRWYHYECDLKNCDILCSRYRELLPRNGAFTMVRQNAIFVNNLLRWQLVDDVNQCARECLVTDDCNSFNFEYNSRTQVVGSLCGLNRCKMADSLGDLKESFEYHYFESLQ